MEFEFPVIITQSYELKKKDERKDQLYVIRFEYMGGKGFAYSKKNITDEVLAKQENGTVLLKFKLRFTDKGVFLWTNF